MENKRTISRCLTLFVSMLGISSFTFGGGFVIVSFMKQKFVDKLHYLEEPEMLDYIALAQSSPGAIAVNAAIMVGWHAAGLPGMIAAVLGTIIPPLVILSVISLFYQAFASNPYVAMVLKGMQAGVAAVIAGVVLSLGSKVLKERSWLSDLIMAAAFIAAYFLKLNVILIILGAACIGLCRSLGRRAK